MFMDASMHEWVLMVPRIEGAKGWEQLRLHGPQYYGVLCFAIPIANDPNRDC